MNLVLFSCKVFLFCVYVLGRAHPWRLVNTQIYCIPQARARGVAVCRCRVQIYDFFLKWRNGISESGFRISEFGIFGCEDVNDC